jgi:hypothetical protein
VVPLLDQLYNLRVTRKEGAYWIVLVPTRELAQQTMMVRCSCPVTRDPESERNREIRRKRTQK